MKRRKKRRSSRSRGTRAVLALVIACAVGIVAVWLIPDVDRRKTPPTPKASSMEEKTQRAAVSGRVYSHQPQIPSTIEASGRATEPGRIESSPPFVRKIAEKKIAVLIDDIGYDPGALRRLLAIEVPLAFSVLPRTPHSKASAEAIHRAGREVLLHLPMEPHGYPDRDPGQGALFVSMSSREIRRTMEENMKSVPHAGGVNNHMGSMFMEKRESLRVVFDVLSERGLYFVDSMTTDASAARELSAQMALRFTPRDFFIDDAEDRGWARVHLERLLEARDQWNALVLIGHPYPETVIALEEIIPQFKSRGIEFVPLSVMVERKQGLRSAGLTGNNSRNRTP